MKRRLAALAGLLVVAAIATRASAAAGKGKAVEPQAAPIPVHADLNGNKLFDNLEDALQAKSKNAAVDVIVQLAFPADDAAVSAMQESVGEFQVNARWDKALNGFSATVTAAQARALARMPSVKSVEPDLPVDAFLDTATAFTGVQQARADYGVNGDRDGNPAAYSTTDVVVAIIDTGIDAAHVDLDGGKVLAFRDEVNGRTQAYDDHGHGTHVASIAAGTGEGNGANKGVAPGAALVGIKVLNGSGSGSTTQIINGINWMISNKATYNIRVANMSLGSSGCSSGTDSLSIAVNNASNNGIAMFVAAGNSGPSKCTIGSPAAAQEAIAVGAAVDPGEKGWGLAPFSSRGLTADNRLKPDLVAPGYNINAARAGSTNQYTTMSGTSMATPFAAGVGALVLDANNGLTVAGLKSVLYANVADWGPAGHDLDYGRGLLLAYNAVRHAAGGRGSFNDGLDHLYLSSSLSGTGATYNYTFTVTDPSKPVGITLIMPNWSGGSNPDFDLYLIGPSGDTLASSTSSNRQEQVFYQPVHTGSYKVRVYSYAGSGRFFFDLSYR